MIDVKIIENHDQALGVWEDYKIKNFTVVHVDAHLDCEPINRYGNINIGNFLRHAIKRGIVKRIIWVIPDLFYENKCCNRFIMSELNDLGTRVTDRIWSITYIVDGIKVSVCSVDKLIKNKDEVGIDYVFDLDIDFFFQKHLCVDYTSAFVETDLNCVRRFYLATSDIVNSAKVVTLCKSVYGGHTPLKFDCVASFFECLIQGFPTNEYDLYNEYLSSQTTVEYNEQFNSYDGICLSAMSVALERGCSTEMRKYFCEVMLLDYPNKIPYVASMYQIAHIGIRRFLRDKLSIAKINYDMYIIFCCKLGLTSEIPPWSSALSLQNKCALADYAFRKHNYVEAYKMLCEVKDEFDNNSEIQAWEGVVSSYTDNIKLSPARVKVLNQLAITASKIGDDKAARRFSKYLVIYGYANREVVDIYNKYYNKFYSETFKPLSKIDRLFFQLRRNRLYYKIYKSWKSGR